MDTKLEFKMSPSGDRCYMFKKESVAELFSDEDWPTEFEKLQEYIKDTQK